MDQTPSTVGPRRRTTIACEYCRQKKLKCDGNRPACHNCGIHGRTCLQVALGKKPRPTKRRIRELEEENRLLRLQVQHRSPTPTQSVGAAGLDSFDQDAQTSVDDSRNAMSVTSSDPPPPPPPPQPRSHVGNTESSVAEQGTPQTTAETPENYTTQYHGPTSASFDLSSRHAAREGHRKVVPPDYERYAASVLCAESAKQRHLEHINLTAGSLDFDGVDPELAMHLLSIYWGRQLHCGLIVYRPAFMRDMACHGPYFSKLLLNAMYFSASKHCSRVDIRGDASDLATAGWMYRKRFTQLLVEDFAKSKITTIQALLIMAVTLFSRCDERSSSWLYAGNAFNMIIDLGLHVFPSAVESRKQSEEDVEVRKRVFWGAYFLDKTQCLLQGRPPILRISDANVTMSFLDNYEELEAFDSTSFSSSWTYGAVPLRYPSTLHKLCELSLVMERILTNIYGANYVLRNPNTFYWKSKALQQELEDWRKNQPAYIDFISHQDVNGVTHPPPLPHQLTIMALYNVLIILLRRPLIIEHHDSSSDISRPYDMAYESFSACLASAKEIVTILRLYKRYYSMTSAPYLLSYAAYICTTILVRLIALGRDGINARQSLATCLEALEQHTLLYKAASRTKVAISVLIQRLGASIELPRPHINTNSMTQQSPSRHESRGEPQHHPPPTVGVQARSLQDTTEQTSTPIGQRFAHHCLFPEPGSSFVAGDSPDQNTMQHDLSIDWLVGTDVDREAVIQSFATNCPGPMQEEPMDDAVQYYGIGHGAAAAGGNSGSMLGGQYLDFDSMNSYIVSEFQGMLQ